MVILTPRALFAWPPQAAVARPVAKAKIYAHAKPSAALHALFVDQVESITWAYKLAPETINLPVCNEGQIPILTSGSRPDHHRPNSRRITVRVGPWANKYFNITVEQRDVVQQAFAGETAEFVVFQF